MGRESWNGANGKGEMGQGKGVRPVVGRMAGLRPAIMLPLHMFVCVFPFILLLEMSERAGDRVCSDRVQRERAAIFRLSG